MELNERSREILKAIIQSYISTAEPVGSRTVTKRYNLGISPATVRNIMSDLEELGFLAQPHTSAGRIPTDKAYRFYIDTLIEVRSLPRPQEQEILNYPLHREDFHQLMQETTKLLSALSHYTGIVMAPKPAETVYKQVEFIRLTGKRVLAIFVSNAGIVHNRMIQLEEDLTQRDLERVSAFLNQEMAGKTLREMRLRVLKLMEDDKNKYTRLLMNLMKVWQDAPQEDETEAEGELFVGGLSEMFNIPDFKDYDKMRELFAAFEEKHSLLRLLDMAIDADGVQVFIGSENKCFEMQGVSLVIASYRSEGNIVGTLGVIGPSRMPYNTVIPLVDCTARVLGRLLSER
ncbi:MAG: heat-inducible transcriptional repressor HrcA [Nitrospirota bacterium]